MTGDGPNIDYTACSLPSHDWRREFDMRQCAADMHRDGTVEDLQRKIFDATAPGWSTGIIDQNV